MSEGEGGRGKAILDTKTKTIDAPPTPPTYSSSSPLRVSLRWTRLSRRSSTTWTSRGPRRPRGTKPTPTCPHLPEARPGSAPCPTPNFPCQRRTARGILRAGRLVWGAVNRIERVDIYSQKHKLSNFFPRCNLAETQPFAPPVRPSPSQIDHFFYSMH